MLDSSARVALITDPGFLLTLAGMATLEGLETALRSLLRSGDVRESRLGATTPVAGTHSPLSLPES